MWYRFVHVVLGLSVAGIILARIWSAPDRWPLLLAGLPLMGGSFLRAMGKAESLVRRIAGPYLVMAGGLVWLFTDEWGGIFGVFAGLVLLGTEVVRGRTKNGGPRGGVPSP